MTACTAQWLRQTLQTGWLLSKGLLPVLNTIVSLGRALFLSQGSDSDSKLSALTARLKHSRVPAASHRFHSSQLGHSPSGKAFILITQQLQAATFWQVNTRGPHGIRLDGQCIISVGLSALMAHVLPCMTVPELVHKAFNCLEEIFGHGIASKPNGSAFYLGEEVARRHQEEWPLLQGDHSLQKLLLLIRRAILGLANRDPSHKGVFVS